MISPVDGFQTLENSVAFDATHLPPLKSSQVFTASLCVTAIANPPIGNQACIYAGDSINRQIITKAYTF
jgi:hypothetical protein